MPTAFEEVTEILRQARRHTLQDRPNKDELEISWWSNEMNLVATGFFSTKEQAWVSIVEGPYFIGEEARTLCSFGASEDFHSNT